MQLLLNDHELTELTYAIFKQNPFLITFTQFN